MLVDPAQRNQPPLGLVTLRMRLDVGALAVGEGVGTVVTTSKGAVTVVEVIVVGSPVDAEIECRPDAVAIGAPQGPSS